MASDQHHSSVHRVLPLLRSLSGCWKLPPTLTPSTSSFLIPSLPYSHRSSHLSWTLLPLQEHQKLKEGVRWGQERKSNSGGSQGSQQMAPLPPTGISVPQYQHTCFSPKSEPRHEDKGKRNYLKDLLDLTYSKKKILRFIEVCIIIITFKIQSAKVILDIEGQVYGQWILSLIYCQLLIREFLSTSLFIKNRNCCKR